MKFTIAASLIASAAAFAPAPTTKSASALGAVSHDIQNIFRMLTKSRLCDVMSSLINFPTPNILFVF